MHMPNDCLDEVIPMLNLEGQYRSIKDEIDGAIRRVVSRQHFILGEEVAALEGEIASYCAMPFAIGVASGTDALILALKAAGVGPGDEVIVPAFSFVATADSVSLLGATPVFADIDPVTYTIDPASLKNLLSPVTRAIIPVHLYGHPAPMREICAFAHEHGLVVLGDTEQALGATYAGAPVASLNEFGCLSFFPSKNLGGFGDGGMIVTKNSEHAKQLKMLRSHGSSKKYTSEFQGWNSRLDELQAAILRAKLPHLDRWNLQRQQKAAAYVERLSAIEGLQLPVVEDGCTSVFHQFTIRVANRDGVQKNLLEAGIQTAVHYPIPLHLQPMYKHLGYRRGDLPEAEKASGEVLSLPIYPELQEAQIDRICSALKVAVESSATAGINS
jgi:dTDP-4-amino-4,6-dideoxygalactose transaminase